MNRPMPCTLFVVCRLVLVGACLLASRLLGGGWPAAISTFGQHFHRMSPGEETWARHEVSRDLVNWTNAGVALPPLPAGKVLGACGAEVAHPAADATQAPPPWHALLVLVDPGVPSLHLLSSADGSHYAIHPRPASLRIPGATTGNLSLLWHSPSRRWVLGTPILDEDGPAISFHGSSNLLDWVPLGRVKGDHSHGGLCEIPERRDKGIAPWVLMDSRGEARIATLIDGQVLPERLRMGTVHGLGSWAFLPTPGVLPPHGRRLVVGLPIHGGSWDSGTPWEVACEDFRDGRHLVWRPAAEFEGLRTRSRLLSVPRLSKAGTNQLFASLPPSCELRMEFPASPHHRVVLRLYNEVLRFDGGRRELSLGGVKATLSPAGDAESWIIVRTPSQLEIVASEGRVRLATAIRSEEPSGPVVLERSGGWWLSIRHLVIHEWDIKPPAAFPRRDPTQ